MTRRDYVKLAAALAISKPETAFAPEYAWKQAVHAVADVLQADNPRFQRDRFLEAAGIQLQRTAAAA